MTFTVNDHVIPGQRKLNNEHAHQGVINRGCVVVVRPQKKPLRVVIPVRPVVRQIPGINKIMITQSNPLERFGDKHQIHGTDFLIRR